MRQSRLASSLQAVRDSKENGSVDPQNKPRKISGVLDVQRGLDQLASGLPREIDPADIAQSEIADRLDVDEGLDSLLISIRTSGQKLPVLVRRSKDGVLPYEIVYGRRRVAACKALGIPVKAYVAELDDREALISQGLENAARLDRSFIEQGVYAQRLLAKGLTREEVGQTLAIHYDSLSRMLVVVSAIPDSLIHAIGAAHNSGRRPWLELKDLLAEHPFVQESELLAMVDNRLDSDEKLQGVLKGLRARTSELEEPRAPKLANTAEHSFHPGLSVKVASRGLKLTHTADDLAGFSEFVNAQMPDLLDRFMATKATNRA